MDKGLAYKNVICLGHILDAEGKKMSKSLGNIVDPWQMADKYGVDTLRLWMYSVNQPGESKNFDEKTVAELHNKVFNLLYNVLAFYELYRNKEQESNGAKEQSANILDQWILARFNQLVETATTNLDSFKLLEPVRAMREFIDDLSTWYVRRSRDRLKEGDIEAKQTLYYVLKNLAKLMAPFAPFAAEDIWQKLKNENDEMSVHMAAWPEAQVLGSSEKVIEEMQKLRELVTLGLQLRQKASRPVRQPLGSLTLKTTTLSPEYLEILGDEMNVKEIKTDTSIATEVYLDTEITPELKKEGDYRELVRSVQDMRKKEGLTPSDMIALTLPESAKDIVAGFEDDLKKTVMASSVAFSGDSISLKK